MVTDSSKEDFSGCWLALLLLPLGLYSAFAEGYVLSKLWVWYAVPLGAPLVRWQVFAAFGLAYGMLRARQPRAEPEDTRPQSMQLMTNLAFVAWPWIVLLIAWVLR